MSDPDDRDLLERDDDAGDRELYRRREREINSKQAPAPKPADVRADWLRPRHGCGCYADEPMPERCPHVEEP